MKVALTPVINGIYIYSDNTMLSCVQTDPALFDQTEDILVFPG